MAETALFALGKWQTRQLAEKFPAAGGKVEQLLARPDDLLSTIVLGNTVANTLLAGVALWTSFAGWWPLPTTALVIVLLLLVVGEVIPKTLAVRLPERWALWVAGPMFLLLRVTGPFQHFAQTLNDFLLRVVIPPSFKPHAGMSERDYQELIELAHQQGALQKTEKEIILQIISLDRRTIRDVMRPRARMACISDDLSVEEMAAAARKFRHRRLPIYDGDLDTIVGVLNTRTLLLNPDGDLADAVEFPSFVPETMNLLQLLKSLQRQKRSMALVLDEFGGTAGIVTMEDILGTIVGHGRQESEASGFVMEPVGVGKWRVSGAMRLDDFRREYPELGEVPDVDTMGGLALTVAEVVPAKGESVIFRGLKLTATDTDERHVRELLVEALHRKGAG
ncbi:MAG: HlyC/CorC family transporter [Verrucomicrobia bacterium]|nr:HlyC/CorC family transporter [Verrucomicrobiota bacterium]